MSDIGSPLYIFFYKGCLMMYLVVWNFHDRCMLSCGIKFKEHLQYFSLEKNKLLRQQNEL